MYLPVPLSVIELTLYEALIATVPVPLKLTQAFAVVDPESTWELVRDVKLAPLMAGKAPVSLLAAKSDTSALTIAPSAMLAEVIPEPLIVIAISCPL